MGKTQKIALLALAVMSAGFAVTLIGKSIAAFYIGVTMLAVGSGIAIQNYWADVKG